MLPREDKIIPMKKNANATQLIVRMCLLSRVPPNFFKLMYTVSRKYTTTSPHITEIAPNNCRSMFAKAIKLG